MLEIKYATPPSSATEKLIDILLCYHNIDVCNKEENQIASDLFIKNINSIIGDLKKDDSWLYCRLKDQDGSEYTLPEYLFEYDVSYNGVTTDAISEVAALSKKKIPIMIERMMIDYHGNLWDTSLASKLLQLLFYDSAGLSKKAHELLCCSERFKTGLLMICKKNLIVESVMPITKKCFGLDGSEPQYSMLTNKKRYNESIDDDVLKKLAIILYAGAKEKDKENGEDTIVSNPLFSLVLKALQDPIYRDWWNDKILKYKAREQFMFEKCIKNKIDPSSLLIRPDRMPKICAEELLKLAQQQQQQQMQSRYPIIEERKEDVYVSQSQIHPQQNQIHPQQNQMQQKPTSYGASPNTYGVAYVNQQSNQKQKQTQAQSYGANTYCGGVNQKHKADQGLCDICKVM